MQRRVNSMASRSQPHSPSRRPGTQGKGQTAMEYTILVAGALFFVLFAVLALRAGVFEQGTHRVASTSNNYLGNYAKSYLLFENFDDSKADKFAPCGGSWAVANFRYVQSDTSSTFCSVAGVTASDFSFVASMQPAVDPVGIIFRAQNASAYYVLTMAHTGSDTWLFAIQKFPLGAALLNKTVTTTTSDWVKLRMDASGTQLHAYADFGHAVNGVAGFYDLGTATDSSADAYPSGDFGLFTQTTSAIFDDVKACPSSPC